MKRFALILFTTLALAFSLDGSLRAQSRQNYYLQDVSNVILPGSELVYQYWEYDRGNAPDRTAVLYRVPQSTHAAWLSKGRNVISDSDINRLEVVAKGPIHLTHHDYSSTGTANFGVQPVGEYLAVTYDPNREYRLATLYNVGTLGTVWHASPGSLLVYAVDLRTMRHRDDVQYTIADAGGSRNALVSIGGLSWAHQKHFEGPVITGRSSDGSTTVQRMWGASGESVGAGFVQTDRPVYRTGQHVYVRAILRTGTVAQYGIPAGTRRVLVRSYDGTTLYDQKRPLSAFGTLWADFTIPQSARLGYYEITIGNVKSSLSVQEYKKPEYLLDAQARTKHVIGGADAIFDINAKYFFGRPAAGMTLHYSAYEQYYYRPFFNPYRFMGFPSPNYGGEPAFEATGQADGAGRLSAAVPTKHVDYERMLQLQVDGRDASGRTASTTAMAEVVPAAYRIEVRPDRWYATLGQAVNVTTSTLDYDGHPRAHTPVEIEIAGEHYDYRTHEAQKLPVQHASVVTDAQGRATFDWRPTAAASYTLRFSGKDERGNTARSSLYFWVSSSQEPWWYPNAQITLIPDKETYAPGERPKLLLTVPQADADALLIVSDDRIESARVLHVGSKPQTLEIDPPKNASRYEVRVEIPGKDGLASGQVSIAVKPAPQRLTVSLTPDKTKYAPGERATVRVHVKDRNGRPVRAELALGIVDEAIYAVQTENRGSALGAFYDNRYTYINSRPSWEFVSNVAPRPVAMPAPGPSLQNGVPAGRGMLKEIGNISSRGANVVASTTADTYSVNGVPTRSYFPDTAFWKPNVVTDANGNAVVSFDWPDTLTTWRASGVAVTLDTAVGNGEQTALVTKDFLVRLEMPRFLRRGDFSQFTGIVNGKPGGARSAQLRLQAGDLLRGGSDEQMVQLDANDTGNAAWPVNPLTSLGIRQITLQGSDGALTDGIKLPIPIEAAGAAEHIRDAAEAHDRSTTSFTLPQMYDSGDLRIALSPSIVASLAQNVRLLDVYPYYCTEQTMSAALPAVFLDRVFKRTGVAPPADSPATAAIVKKAVARLGELQHEDGSWGWWETDSAHPFMTAYALYGLAEFRKAGYAVPAPMFDRGVASLLGQIQSSNDDTLRLWGGRQADSQWNTRAFMLYSLAQAAPARMDRGALAATMQHAGELNDYALAVLGLAQHALHEDNAARTVLARLNSHMTGDGAYAFWLGQTWHYAWQDDPIETTAYALRLNNALEPNSGRVKKVVNFLRTQQRGNWWYTTKDTAAAVYALTEAVPVTSGEFHPDETVNVYSGMKKVASLHVTQAVLDERLGNITVPAADLRSGGNIRFEVSGPGSLYWSTDWTRYAPPYARKVYDAQESILARLQAKPSSFSIERRYEAKRTPWQVGDEVNVDVMVRTDSDTDYVAIEDPFPAGAEYQPLQGQGAENWSGLQFFDDRAVFFADHLQASYPLHLRYTLRVTTPGVYTAAPPIAYAMYGPPVSSVGQPDRVTVR